MGIERFQLREVKKTPSISSMPLIRSLGFLLIGFLLCSCQKADVVESSPFLSSRVALGSFCSVEKLGPSLRRSAENELHFSFGDDSVYLHELTPIQRRNLRRFILSRLDISKKFGFHADSNSLKTVTDQPFVRPFDSRTIVLSDGHSSQVLHWFGGAHWVEIHVMGGEKSSVDQLKRIKEQVSNAIICSVS